MGISVRMKVTIPSQLFSYYIVKEQIRSALQHRTGPRMMHLFRGTVTGWKNKPDFKQEFTENFAMMAVKVFASGRNERQYKIVNDGAEPHPIYPRDRRGFLIFKPGYVSSTKPYSLSSRPFVRHGQDIGVRSVQHPGFGGRFFDVVIADTTADDFYEDVQDAVKIGVQRTQSTQSTQSTTP